MKNKILTILIIVLFVFGFTILPQNGNAQSQTTSSDEGFIIEADSVEGVLSLPGIVNGETSKTPKKLMLRLGFIHATINGLTLTKVTNTPSGPITIKIKSQGPVKLSNMNVDVTKIEFGEIYIPRLGEIGMKKVRLVAHKQTADIANLPNLNVHFEQNGSLDTIPDSPEKLKEISEKLGTLLQESEKESDEHFFPITLEELLNGKKKDEDKEPQKKDELIQDGKKEEDNKSKPSDEQQSNEQENVNEEDEQSTDPTNHSDGDCKTEDTKDTETKKDEQNMDQNISNQCTPAEANESDEEKKDSAISQQTENVPFNHHEESNTNIEDEKKTKEENNGLLDLLFGILP